MGYSTMVKHFKPQSNSKTLRKTIEDIYEKIEALEGKKMNNEAKELYDLIGTYVQDGKVLTNKEWKLIGGILKL